MRGLARSVTFMGGLLASSCYMGPVNMRPTISIRPPVATFSRGSSPVYEATASDPDGQVAKVEWATTPTSCPSPAKVQQPSNWPAAGWMQSPNFKVPSTVTGAAFCVWAKATDRHGAVAIDALDGQPGNHAPVGKLQREPSTSAVALRTTIVFTSSGTDVDPGDDPHPTGWFFDSAPVPIKGLSFVDCPPPDAGDPNKRCFTAQVPGEYEVSVEVSDGIDKSLATNKFIVQPGNVPIAKLDIKAPLVPAAAYPLGTWFHISGAKSSDADPSDALEAKWSTPEELRSKNPTSGASLVPCDEMGAPLTGGEDDFPLERCFRADTPGIYRVSLTVSDGMNQSAPEVMELAVVGDAPPCLKVTDPDMGESTIAATIDPESPIKWFKVLRVDDDLDPYPPDPAGDALHDRTTFRWLVDDDGRGFKPAWGDFASFPFPTDTYRYGDEVSVRLEIFDRMTNAASLLGCTGPVCSTSASCVQRVTWKVVFKL